MAVVRFAEMTLGVPNPLIRVREKSPNCKLRKKLSEKTALKHTNFEF
jgi:hypothetical protein